MIINEILTLLSDIESACDGKECRNGSHCKNGKCICPTSCDNDKYKPVCGSDGHTVRASLEFINPFSNVNHLSYFEIELKFTILFSSVFQ